MNSLSETELCFASSINPLINCRAIILYSFHHLWNSWTRWYTCKLLMWWVYWVYAQNFYSCRLSYMWLYMCVYIYIICVYICVCIYIYKLKLDQGLGVYWSRWRHWINWGLERGEFITVCCLKFPVTLSLKGSCLQVKVFCWVVPGRNTWKGSCLDLPDPHLENCVQKPWQVEWLKHPLRYIRWLGKWLRPWEELYIPL